jgi:hypothetical protein
MKLKKLMAVMTLAFLLSPSIPFIAADPTLSVAVDEVYEPGEKVKLSGVAVAGAEVYLLVLFGETPDTIFEEALTADEDGEFSIELQLPENASEGLYTVTVLSGERARSRLRQASMWLAKTLKKRKRSKLMRKRRLRKPRSLKMR